MSRSQRFFRVLSRINAVFLFLACSAIVVVSIVAVVQSRSNNASQRKAAQAESPVDSSAEEEAFRLEQATVEDGSGVVRIELVSTSDTGGKGIGSSGISRQTRNILFFEKDSNTAHWLLPDKQHRLSEVSEVLEKPGSETSRSMATATIVRAATDPEISAGRLLLFDRSGKTVVEVSKNATQVDVASLVGPELVLVYHRNSRLVRASFDPGTLSKRTEQEIELPPLK